MSHVVIATLYVRSDSRDVERFFDAIATLRTLGRPFWLEHTVGDYEAHEKITLSTERSES